MPAKLIVAWRVPHSDIPLYMSACDALVFTSMQEGSPNVVKEALACNLPANRQFHHFQEKVGHYGIFNGSRWKKHIMPRIRHVIRQFNPGHSAIPEKDLAEIPDKKPAQWNKSLHGVEAVRKRLKEKNLPKVGMTEDA